MDKMVEATALRTFRPGRYIKEKNRYQPSGAGGTRLPPANPKWPPVGPKMTDRVWKGAYS